MRVLLTGGGGYIGNAVARALHAAGPRVVALARSDAAAERLHDAGVHVERGDTQDAALLARLAADADAVIHCAFGGNAAAIPVERAALETIAGAVKPDAKIVYTSGCWVYGSRGDALVDETAPVNPLALVAFRTEHEKIFLDARARGVRAVVLRPAIVYGEGQGIVQMLVEEGRRGPVTVVGDGTNRWPMVRVDALADLYVRVVEHREADGVYNAQHGRSEPYLDIARAASRAAGGDGSVHHVPVETAREQMGPFADALACDLQTSSARAARDLGWKPDRPSVIEELANTVVS